ncbi:outer membrane lipoprotein LolB [Duganella sp. CF402]|uniref:lipoprotein insertase outer membrane protein LolB n=1 Tax=unclassified Duganella TaxID=2636909 RepID=UPI0008B8281C|nr:MULTISPECIES: lipoprotein insertase outer membrane protein LolB [unclassified Duganella]RZT06054.1 outer membrane lipoprotein LolB [Duganella sp. BK701]SEM77795.1 outer membrane lipoprotein LolB [Duganella sp. CF402]
MIRPLLISLAVSAALAGCATTSSAPRSSAAVAPYRDSVELAGRIAINYSRDGKKESLNGKFTWQQGRASTDVTLISPTGQTVAVINVTPSSATLKESGKQPLTAPDLDTLTQKTLGWTLPVSGLRDWLQGYAVASDGKRFVASPANDNVITRDGWKLEYMSWQDDTAAVPQPKRIDVTRIALGQAVDDMAIRIVIDPAAQ